MSFAPPSGPRRDLPAPTPPIEQHWYGTVQRRVTPMTEQEQTRAKRKLAWAVVKLVAVLTIIGTVALLALAR